jgi:hypothetical protein
MFPWRPAVLSDQNREQVFAVKKEIQPWVKVILQIRRYGARRTLDAQGTEREILQRRAAGQSLPPVPFIKKTLKPVPDASLRWLVGLVYDALARCDGKGDAESVTDLITRRLFSKLGLPESGTEPLLRTEAHLAALSSERKIAALAGHGQNTDNSASEAERG